MISFNTKIMRMGLIGALLGLADCNASLTSRCPEFEGTINNERIAFAKGTDYSILKITKGVVIDEDVFVGEEKIFSKGHLKRYKHYKDNHNDGIIDYLIVDYSPNPDNTPYIYGYTGTEIKPEHQKEYDNYLIKIIEKSKNN